MAAGAGGAGAGNMLSDGKDDADGSEVPGTFTVGVVKVQKRASSPGSSNKRRSKRGASASKARSRRGSDASAAGDDESVSGSRAQSGTRRASAHMLPELPTDTSIELFREVRRRP